MKSIEHERHTTVNLFEHSMQLTILPGDGKAALERAWYKSSSDSSPLPSCLPLIFFFSFDLSFSIWDLVNLRFGGVFSSSCGSSNASEPYPLRVR